MKNIIKLPRPAYIISSAAVVGEEEFGGPLGNLFDFHSVDEDTFGCDTWEKSESEMQKKALTIALKKSALEKEELDCIFAGDLINQCSASNYGLLSFDLPFLGIYGACSTAAEGIMLASCAVSTGLCRKAAAVTSSHNASAERQFRFPLEYGAQRCPTCQWTVTGSGAFILSSEDVGGANPFVTEVLAGRAVDAGICDANNMGAAMAPAAADTLLRYFEECDKMPQLILTGDLGHEGGTILCDIMKKKGIDISSVYGDCGLMIFDRKGQDKHAGGSGCGCSATVLAAHILKLLREGELENAVFVGTGALMSPMSIQQGQNIPGIGHLVKICAKGAEK